jgi:phosphatidylserine/phosphatidylglycerophosphate/cardiolipin synthase-like enzyme
MAKFLSTTGISYQLEELIKNTKDRLILISPYLQFSERIKENIKNLNIQKKDIRIIYRENKLHPEESNWLADQIGVRTSICKNLHAKCYINESAAIITSMNLYQFSQINNNEMGIYISREQDPDVFKDAWEESLRLLAISDEIRVTVEKILDNGSKKKEDKKPINVAFCIRSGSAIPFNIERPMSAEAYKKWNEYGDPNYPEKYCHFTGEQSHGETSFKQPIMKKNWKKAKEIHGL